MSSHRTRQNIRIPEYLRRHPQQTSIDRTVSEIRPSGNLHYREIGFATVFERRYLVATQSGKFWVILEAQRS